MCEHLFRLYTKCPAENTIKQHQQYSKGWINGASKPEVCLLALIKYKKLHQKKKKKKKKDDLQTQSLHTIILTAFYGFKRSSKVSSLCRSDSRFKGTLIKIFIQKSKTRVQKRQLVVFTSFNSVCPVQQLRFYLDMSKINENSDEYIVRSISRTKIKIKETERTYIVYTNRTEFYSSFKSSWFKMEGVWAP